jgi:hypothetical protein
MQLTKDRDDGNLRHRARVAARSAGRRKAHAVVRAVIFDVDGTLVDTNDLHTASWVEAFRQLRP